MPKKANEKKEVIESLENEKKPTKSKLATSKQNKTTKSNVSSISKKATKSKKNNDTKVNSKSKNTKSKSTKTSKNKSTSKTTKKTKKVPKVVTEYYDLPFRYNQTVVKILAQTPNTLFIYWDISNEDRQSYQKKYGDEFFNHTRPYLIITNKTMNYTFEVEINDFANSWYLHINDTNCEYAIELCRKFITNSNHDNANFTPYHINDYLSITFSNELETPNNHILFDQLGKTVFFRNVKTNYIEEKNIYSLSFMKNLGKVYNIYDLYKQIYNDELIFDELIFDELGTSIPSSSNSSTFK